MKDLEAALSRHRRAGKKRGKARGFWRALGMLGSIGWTVILPALLGAWLGDWLDERARASFSWKLSGLLGGLSLGCAAAWQRVHQQWLELAREEAESRGN